MAVVLESDRSCNHPSIAELQDLKKGYCHLYTYMMACSRHELIDLTDLLSVRLEAAN